MKSIISFLLFVVQLGLVVAKPSVLFPLYIYPSPGAWQPLYWALGNYTQLTFKIIINPASGPFRPGYSAGDLSNYVREMKTLNAYANAKTFGYVDTNYPNRADDDIVHDIDYWRYAPDSSLIPSGGIFFDDVVTTSSGALWQLNNVQTYARQDNFQQIIFNPGTTPAFPDPRYPGTQTVSGVYNMANETLVYENYYGVPTPTGPATPSNVASFITQNNHGVSPTRLSGAVYALPTDSASNSVAGGCAVAKSFICNFTNSFTGVVDSLYLSNLGSVAAGANYAAFPPNFLTWVSILAGAN